MTQLPPRPADDSERALGFARATMTRWLSPSLLFATAVRVGISAVLGSYADKREEMAALPAAPPADLSDGAEPPGYAEAPDGGELWFDYVSDLGDGFDATYAMASLLATPSLDLAGTTTPRGRMLVMGGDQCYPTPSITGYENKLIGPYRAALPRTCPDPAGAPRLFVLPGNHDWYDGLTAFMRVFCQGSSIGGWRTEQTRSYFAVQLPHRWWLLGIDIQFDSYIDDPQRRYFIEIAARMRPGDAVILCSAKPSWLSAADGDAEAYAVLDYFERTIIRKVGAQVRVSLTGDRHHYARYSECARDTEVGGSAQKFTAGGGGAYLSATHRLPQRLVLPPTASRAPGKSDPPAHYELASSTFPDAQTSRRLAAGIVGLPAFAPGLIALLGGVHLLLALAIGGAAGTTGRGAVGRLDAIAAGLRHAGVPGLFEGLINSVPGLALSLGVMGAGVALTKAGRTARGGVAGVAHGLTQLVLAVAVIAGAVAVAGPLPGTWLLAGVLPLVVAVGGLAATEVLAAYLWLADRIAGLNTNELFAAQGIADYKNFLRLRIGPDGQLTIYPVGVRAVPKRWRFAPDAAAGTPWFTPIDRPLEAFLIESPITITRAAPDQQPDCLGPPGAREGA
ncbi:metallophosphoesterase [Frankia sp. Cas3]|uniref:metallophosphoesterase n=1 Tax=Frankia sp. Cas3 TaxID=3073926 RepID=UPI002AD3C87B|nr:metallophosphoesterase [Frankia sp. Cas3]